MFQILLVDDETTVLNGLKKFINWHYYGFEIKDCASSVAQALYLCESYEYDLIITDIQMPVQNGIELIKIIRNIYPKIKIIVLSSFAEFEYAQESLRLGVIDYIVKPVNFEQINNLLLKLQKLFFLEKESINKELSKSIIMNMIHNKKYEKNQLREYFDLYAPFQIIMISTTNKEELKLSNLLAYIDTHFDEAIVITLTPAIFMIKTKIINVYRFNILQNMCMSFNLFIGISKNKYTIYDIQSAYIEAERALHYQSLRNSHVPLLYENISNLFLSSSEDSKFDFIISGFLDPKNHNMIRIHINNMIQSIIEPKSPDISQIQNIYLELIMKLSQMIQKNYSISTENYQLVTNSIIMLFNSNKYMDIKNTVNNYLDFCFNIVRQNHDSKSKDLISEIIDYINLHYPEKITLKSISENFYISPVYLSTFFKKKMNINFVDYLTDIRLKKAQEYLLTSCYSSSQISTLVGFDNPRYFTKVFKKKIGLTPIEFRKSKTRS
ncbi:two-component system, response regulator YesN [Enterococcus sp. DIV0421]|uniref:response regulator transcription factor n=1 Tax=Enterococcus sp. DIV0421 TaxID=2774688 RepID=UPI003F23FC3A